jgi:hypothetical protein
MGGRGEDMTRRQDRLRRVLCFFGLHKDFYLVPSQPPGRVFACPFCGVTWLNLRKIFRDGDD